MPNNVIELNVGGCIYTALESTLSSVQGSRLVDLLNAPHTWQLDKGGHLLIDRNGEIFSYILDYLRSPNDFVLPDSPGKRERLRVEAEHFRLPGLVAEIKTNKRYTPCTITLSYRGQLPNGRDNLADVQFRRIMRILVSGRSSVCREVFGETLNESRAPDCGPEDDRYSNRYYLTHNTLEMAFDKLLEAGFSMAGCCGESASGAYGQRTKSVTEIDEGKSQYFHEFYFVRM